MELVKDVARKKKKSQLNFDILFFHLIIYVSTEVSSKLLDNRQPE